MANWRSQKIFVGTLLLFLVHLAWRVAQHPFESPCSLAIWSLHHTCRLAILNHAQPLFGPERTWKLTSGMFCYWGAVCWFDSHICLPFVLSNFKLWWSRHSDERKSIVLSRVVWFCNFGSQTRKTQSSPLFTSINGFGRRVTMQAATLEWEVVWPCWATKRKSWKRNGSLLSTTGPKHVPWAEHWKTGYTRKIWVLFAFVWLLVRVIRSLLRRGVLWTKCLWNRDGPLDWQSIIKWANPFR